MDRKKKIKLYFFFFIYFCFDSLFDPNKNKKKRI